MCVHVCVGVLYLWGVRVVKHAEDHAGHGVLGVRHVSGGGEGGQVVLQRLTEHAVEGDVRPEDVALLPAVLLQLLDLGPQTVQVLEGGSNKTLAVCVLFRFTLLLFCLCLPPHHVK